MGVYQEVWVGEEPPGGQPVGSNESLWYKSSTKEWYDNHSGSWQVIIPNVEGTGLEIDGDGEITGKLELGSISVDGEDGVDSNVVIGTTTLKFKGGILYEVEEE